MDMTYNLGSWDEFGVTCKAHSSLTADDIGKTVSVVADPSGTVALVKVGSAGDKVFGILKTYEPASGGRDALCTVDTAFSRLVACTDTTATVGSEVICDGSGGVKKAGGENDPVGHLPVIMALDSTAKTAVIFYK